MTSKHSIQYRCLLLGGLQNKCECGYLTAHGTTHSRGMRTYHRVFDTGSSVLNSDVESVSVVDSEDTCSRYVVRPFFVTLCCVC